MGDRDWVGEAAAISAKSSPSTSTSGGVTSEKKKEEEKAVTAAEYGAQELARWTGQATGVDTESKGVYTYVHNGEWYGVDPTGEFTRLGSGISGKEAAAEFESQVGHRPMTPAEKEVYIAVRKEPGGGIREAVQKAGYYGDIDLYTISQHGLSPEAVQLAREAYHKGEYVPGMEKIPTTGDILLYEKLLRSPLSTTDAALIIARLEGQYSEAHRTAEALYNERTALLESRGLEWDEAGKLSEADKAKYKELLKQEKAVRGEARELNSYLIAARGKLEKKRPLPEGFERMFAMPGLRPYITVTEWGPEGGFGFNVDVIEALRGGVEPGAFGEIGIGIEDIGKAQEWLTGQKVRETALGELAPWEVAPVIFPGQVGFGIQKGGYNIAGALASGIPASTLLTAGFSAEKVKEAETQAALMVGPPGALAAPIGRRVMEWTKEDIPYLRSLGYGESEIRMLTGQSQMELPFLDRVWQALTRPPTEAQAVLTLATLGLGGAFATTKFVPPIFQVSRTALMQLVKWGGVTVAATGTGALGAGLVVSPPEIETTPYEAVDVGKIGTARSQQAITEFVTFGTEGEGRVDVAGMVERYGEGQAMAMLAQAGLKPSIPLEVYERLSPEAQAAYTPSKRSGMAYEPGIAGVYGRGVEYLLKPPVTFFQEKVGGIPGLVGAGIYQYMVPHTLFTQLYPEKGAIAAVTLLPHFGPTAAYTGLTWEEQPWYGKAMGIGFAALPFVVGPAISGLRTLGGVVSRIPVVGPVATGVSRIVTFPLRAVGEAIRPLGLEYWAPWRGAYELGKVVPGYGKWAYGKGWLGPTVSYSEMMRQWGAKPIWGTETAARQPRFPSVGERVEWIVRPEPGGAPLWSLEPGVPVGHVAPLPSFSSFSGSLRGMLTYTRMAAPVVIPRISTAAIYAAPIVSIPFLPMMAPAVVDISVLATTDIAAIDQMLKEGRIAPTQHEQIVSRIEVAQEVSVTQSQYQQQVRDVIREQLTQEQVQQVQDAVQQQVQQELQQQQEVLQQMQQQEVAQWQIQEQQQVVQQLQQQGAQYPILQQIEYPVTPPEGPPFDYPPPPFVPPWSPGEPRIGTGWARGRKALPVPFAGKMWPFGELVIHMPEFLSLEKQRHVLRKAGKRPYGGRVARKTFGRRKGIRV